MREESEMDKNKKKKSYKTQSFAELATAMTTFPLRITFAQGFIVGSGCTGGAQQGRAGQEVGGSG